MDKFMDSFKSLYSFSVKEFELCPWIKTFDVNSFIGFLKSEIDELETALKENDNVCEEAADVFRDALLLLLAVSKHKGIPPEKFISMELEKIRRRKPWVEKGETVDIDEAKRIWQRVKEMERNGAFK